jgi:hypothetical protein
VPGRTAPQAYTIWRRLSKSTLSCAVLCSRLNWLLTNAQKRGIKVLSFRPVWPQGPGLSAFVSHVKEGKVRLWSGLGHTKKFVCAKNVDGPSKMDVKTSFSAAAANKIWSGASEKDIVRAKAGESRQESSSKTGRRDCRGQESPALVVPALDLSENAAGAECQGHERAA